MKTYFAQSIWVSRTFWVNIAVIVLAMAEAKDIINVLPPGVMKYVPTVIAIINIILRKTTVRPVAFIRPGRTKPVFVKTL